jgi:hypothetical protein
VLEQPLYVEPHIWCDVTKHNGTHNIKTKIKRKGLYLCFFRNVGDQISQPYNMKGKIVVLENNGNKLPATGKN